MYAKAKKIADTVYDRPSAYKSGFIVKKYKDDGQEKKVEKVVQREMDEYRRQSSLPGVPSNQTRV